MFEQILLLKKARYLYHGISDGLGLGMTFFAFDSYVRFLFTWGVSVKKLAQYELTPQNRDTPLGVT